MKLCLLGILCCLSFLTWCQNLNELRVPLHTKYPLIFELMQIDSQSISLCYSDKAENNLVIQKISTTGDVLHKSMYKKAGDYRNYLGYFENNHRIHVFFGDDKKHHRYHVYTLDKRTNEIEHTKLNRLDIKRRSILHSTTSNEDQLFQLYIDDAHRKVQLIYFDDQLNVRYRYVNFNELLDPVGIKIKQTKRTFFRRSNFLFPKDISRLDWFHSIHSKSKSKYYWDGNTLCLIFEPLIITNKKTKEATLASLYMTYDATTEQFDVFDVTGSFDHDMESKQSFLLNDELFQLSLDYSKSKKQFNYYLSRLKPTQRQVDTLMRFNATDIPILFDQETFTRFNPYFIITNKNTKIWNESNITNRGVTVLTNANRRPYNNWYENRKLFSIIETSNGYDMLLGIMKNGRLMGNHEPLGDLAFTRQYGIGATPYSSEYYFVTSTLNTDFEFTHSSDGFYREMLERYSSMDLNNMSRLNYVTINDRIYFSYIDKSTQEFVITPINY